MAEKHLEKGVASLVIREMQIKTTLRFQLTPVRMAKVKNSGAGIRTGWKRESTLRFCPSGWWRLC